ncbi:MAG TPA: GNAT family N-acetyltransferase [Candidatus Dormibacteraeota bacterium]
MTGVRCGALLRGSRSTSPRFEPTPRKEPRDQTAGCRRRRGGCWTATSTWDASLCATGSNERLREVGGHIGYGVRRSARRRGHATAMLRGVLPKAFALGIHPALVTCRTDNLASRRVIEHNGGVLEDERRGELRYWVPTADGTRVA